MSSDGENAGTLNVIETISPKFQITLHLRNHKPTKQYDVNVTLYYVKPGEPKQVLDQCSTQFVISTHLFKES